MIDDTQEWYSPAGVVPTVRQLTDFVLPNLDQLRDGTWPVDPRPTGYIGGNKSTRTGMAPFVNAAELAAEIDQRMDRIQDSIALILFYTAHPPWTLQAIAQSLHYRDIDYLEREMGMMLRYIAGRKRKALSYSNYKSDRLRKSIKSQNFSSKRLDKREAGI